MFELPKEIPSLLGPVSVELVEFLPDADEDECGHWHHDDRTIRIKKSLHEIAIEHTFYHEQMHMILEDSGVAQILRKRQEEAVCDAYASFKLAVG